MFENGLEAIGMPASDLSSTTHPTLQQPMTEQLQDNAQLGQTTAQTGLINANTGLVGEQATGANIANQVSRMGLANAQALGQSYQHLAQQGQASGQQTPSTPSIMSGQGQNGQPVTSTNDQSTPGQTPVLPSGVQPGWKVDKNADWYVDENGAPVSHMTGPAYSPSGRPNLYNEDNINKMYDSAIQLAGQNGGNPATLIAAKQEALKNAQAFDKTNADIQKAQSDAAETQQKLKDLVTAHAGDAAYQILHSPNPHETIATLMAQQPRLIGSLLQGAGAQSPDDLVDPTTNQITPKFAQLLTPLAAQSNLAKTQSEIETQAANRRSLDAGVPLKKAEAEGRVFTNINDASKAVADATSDLIAKNQALTKTQEALKLAQEFYGSHPTATLNDLKTYFGMKPEWAEYKALIAPEGLATVKEAVGRDSRLNQTEVRAILPSQINPTTPARAAINLLSLQAKGQQLDYAAAQSSATNVKKAASPFGVDTTALDRAASAPTTMSASPGQRKVSVGANGVVTATNSPQTTTRLNGMRTDTDGSTWVKISDGPDNVAGAWKLVRGAK